MPKLMQKYAHLLRDKPVSHLIAFGVLHELTAIVPLPLVYLSLSWLDIPLPFPRAWLEEGNRRMNAMLQYFFKTQVKEDSRALMYMGMSYAAVKAALPLRIGLCLYWMPGFARIAVDPFRRLAMQLLRNKKDF